jgi:hypothetical protein
VETLELGGEMKWFNFYYHNHFTLSYLY